MIYIVVFIRFKDPTLEIIFEKEDIKWASFVVFSIGYVIAVFIILALIGNYDTIHSVVSSIGEIYVILGIGWGLGVIAIGLCLLGKQELSNRFSIFVLLFLLLSLAWDWLLFPEFPFPTWSPVLIIVFGVLLEVLIEMGIKGAFERLKSLRKRSN